MTEVCVLTLRGHEGEENPLLLHPLHIHLGRDNCNLRTMLLPLEGGRTRHFHPLEELFSCGLRCWGCGIFFGHWQCLWGFSAFADSSLKCVLDVTQETGMAWGVSRAVQLFHQHTCVCFLENSLRFAVIDQWNFSYGKKKILGICVIKFKAAWNSSQIFSQISAVIP